VPRPCAHALAVGGVTSELARPNVRGGELNSMESLGVHATRRRCMLHGSAAAARALHDALVAPPTPCSLAPGAERLLPVVARSGECASVRAYFCILEIVLVCDCMVTHLIDPADQCRRVILSVVGL